MKLEARASCELQERVAGGRQLTGANTGRGLAELEPPCSTQHLLGTGGGAMGLSRVQ